MAREIDLSSMSIIELQQLRQEVEREESKKRFELDWEESWNDLKGKVFKREEAIEAILSSPSEEETKRWAGLTHDEIVEDINIYLDIKEDEHIGQYRLVAEIDSIAREMHINSSPRLAQYRRK
jgi:hypothetical protein